MKSGSTTTNSGGEMCGLKRLLFTLLFVLFLSVPVFSQDQLQPSADLWNNIEWSLNWLDSEQMLSQIRLQELEKKLELSEKACQDKELVQLNLENSLAKSEQDTKKWKTCSIVLGTTTVTFTVATVVLIVVMVNK